MGNIGTAVSSFLAPPIAYYRLANDGKKLFNYHCYFRNFNVHFGDKNEPKVKVPLASQFKNYHQIISYIT